MIKKRMMQVLQSRDETKHPIASACDSTTEQKHDDIKCISIYRNTCLVHNMHLKPDSHPRALDSLCTALEYANQQQNFELGSLKKTKKQRRKSRPSLKKVIFRTPTAAIIMI